MTDRLSSTIRAALLAAPLLLAAPAAQAVVLVDQLMTDYNLTASGSDLDNNLVAIAPFYMAADGTVTGALFNGAPGDGLDFRIAFYADNGAAFHLPVATAFYEVTVTAHQLAAPAAVHLLFQTDAFSGPSLDGDTYYWLSIAQTGSPTTPLFGWSDTNVTTAATFSNRIVFRNASGVFRTLGSGAASFQLTGTSGEATPTPAPAALALFGFGLVGLGALRRRLG